MKRIALVLILLASSACIHKTGGKVTPMERVTTDNAVLAQMINTVEQGTEAVVNTYARVPLAPWFVLGGIAPLGFLLWRRNL